MSLHQDASHRPVKLALSQTSVGGCCSLPLPAGCVCRIVSARNAVLASTQRLLRQMMLASHASVVPSHVRLRAESLCPTTASCIGSNGWTATNGILSRSFILTLRCPPLVHHVRKESTAWVTPAGIVSSRCRISVCGDREPMDIRGGAGCSYVKKKSPQHGSRQPA